MKFNSSSTSSWRPVARARRSRRPRRAAAASEAAAVQGRIPFARFATDGDGNVPYVSLLVRREDDLRAGVRRHRYRRQDAALDERQARIVELRFFAGLSNADVAALLVVSETTAKTDWRGARAWLRGALS